MTNHSQHHIMSPSHWSSHAFLTCITTVCTGFEMLFHSVYLDY